MSCRVIGRGVEALVLAELAARAAARGCARVEGCYVPTERNGMVADLYARLGMAETGSRGRRHHPLGGRPRCAGGGASSMIAVERA